MRNLIVIITLIMSLMLFLNNPLNEGQRFYQSIWNTGHLFLFGFITWLLITQTSLFKRDAFKMLQMSLLFSLLLGGLIEVLQSVVGRYMEWQDLLTDLMGGVLGFLAVQYFMEADRREVSRLLAAVLAVILLLIVFYPVYRVFEDEAKIASDFPMIANFESDEDILRWDSRHVKRFAIDSQLQEAGRASAQVVFGPGEYPAVSLLDLFHDWSGYRYLNISVHNDQKAALLITLKVYDGQHRKNTANDADRFNRKFRLKPGWNHLQIRLLDVLNAPQHRQMDMHDIATLSLFMMDLQQRKSIHLDNIHLSN